MTRDLGDEVTAGTGGRRGGGSSDTAAVGDATIRVAGADDLDELCRLRLAFIGDVRGTDPADFDPAFVAATTSFFVDAMRADRIRSWLAASRGRNVGLVSLLLADVPPLPERPLVREGYLINMYVAPEGRRRGIGRALLDAALGAAADLELRGFHLYATEDGRPLYEQAGFVDAPRFMVRRAAER